MRPARTPRVAAVLLIMAVVLSVLPSKAYAATITNIGRFNVTANSAALIQDKRLTTGSDNIDYLQSFGFSGTDIYTFSIDARKSNPTPDRFLRVTRLNASGSILSAMTLDGFYDHGAVTGVETATDGVYVWVVNRKAAGGWKITRIKYQAGATITPADPRAVVRTPPEVPSTAGPEASIDPVAKRMVLRYGIDMVNGRWSKYVIVGYSLSDADAGRWTNPDGTSRKAFSVTVPSPQGDTAEQGFTVVGSYAYFYEGEAYGQPGTGAGSSNSCDPTTTTTGNTCLSVVDLNTGKLVQRAKTRAYWNIPYREPEGISTRYVDGKPQLTFGFVGSSAFPHVAYIAVKTPDSWMPA